MSLPSAVGNTISPTSINKFLYPYTIQIKLLAMQGQLHYHLNDLFAEITKEFDDYSLFIEKEKEKQKPSTNSPKQEDETKIKCSTMQCLSDNVNNL